MNRIMTPTVEQMACMWSVSSHIAGFCPAPTALSEGVDGNLIILWEIGSKVAEIEISPSGTLEWFTYNRDDKNHQGSDDECLTCVPGQFVEFLQSMDTSNDKPR